MGAGPKGQTPGQRQHSGIAGKEREWSWSDKWKNGYTTVLFCDEQYT